MKNVTLIIPAKNESEALPIVLSKLRKLNLKIMIVLHKSDVKTINSIKKFKVRILYQTSHGYGDALVKGIKNCKTELFCIFNADGSFKANEIFKMIKLLQSKNLDFVFGSRYQKNAKSHDDTIITLLGNFFFTKFGQIFFGLPITDILYTFVLGKTAKAKKLKLIEKNFAFCVELPIKAVRKNMTIGSSSAVEFKRIAGEKKVNEFRDGLKILYSMIKLLFKNA